MSLHRAARPQQPPSVVLSLVLLPITSIGLSPGAPLVHVPDFEKRSRHDAGCCGLCVWGNSPTGRKTIAGAALYSLRVSAGDVVEGDEEPVTKRAHPTQSEGKTALKQQPPRTHERLTAREAANVANNKNRTTTNNK